MERVSSQGGGTVRELVRTEPGHSDNGPREGREAEKAKATSPRWGGLPWPVSMRGRVSVDSVGPQGPASLPSLSWRVRRLPWLWPRLKDFQVSAVYGSCGRSAGQPGWPRQH